ncbi:hypothetical protein [Paenibacillus sp. PvR148]
MVAHDSDLGITLSIIPQINRIVGLRGQKKNKSASSFEIEKPEALKVLRDYRHIDEVHVKGTSQPTVKAVWYLSG